MQSYADALSQKGAAELGLEASGLADLQGQLGSIQGSFEDKLKNVSANFIRFSDEVTYAKIQAARLNDASWKDMVEAARTRGRGVMARVASILDRVSIIFKKLTADVKLKEYAPGELTEKEIKKITKKNVENAEKAKEFQKKQKEVGPLSQKYFNEAAEGGLIQTPGFKGAVKRLAQEDVQLEFEFIKELSDSLDDKMSEIAAVNDELSTITAKLQHGADVEQAYPLPRAASKDAERDGKEYNPWAVCTESVGRENKDKYERCVLDVKKKNREGEDALPGGKGDKASLKDFDTTEVGMGMKVEMEHTSDPKVAAEIVCDHLTENPKYYSKLGKAGLADELKEREACDMIETAGSGKIGDDSDKGQVGGDRKWLKFTSAKYKHGGQGMRRYMASKKPDARTAALLSEGFTLAEIGSVRSAGKRVAYFFEPSELQDRESFKEAVLNKVREVWVTELQGEELFQPIVKRVNAYWLPKLDTALSGLFNAAFPVDEQKLTTLLFETSDALDMYEQDDTLEGVDSVFQGFIESLKKL